VRPFEDIDRVRLKLWWLCVAMPDDLSFKANWGDPKRRGIMHASFSACRTASMVMQSTCQCPQMESGVLGSCTGVQ
jgi:hypothetical protein